MDSLDDDDVSARDLLRHVLHTEPSRSPAVTRSVSWAKPPSLGSRRSLTMQRGRSDVGSLTPQEALKRSMIQKLRQSTSRTYLPPSKRRTVSAVVRKMRTPAPATSSDDDVTPRHLLRRILQTEPETSLLLQDRPVMKELSADSSLQSNRPSTGLSDLDLPDMTLVNLPSTGKGLSRKRPRRSLDVTTFERHLEGSGGDRSGNSAGDLSDMSQWSSATLSLKTPFVDKSERKGLQRKVAHRQIISVEDFDNAVQNRQTGGDPEMGFRDDRRGLSLVTLGMTDLEDPDITNDIFASKTTLYAHPVTEGTGEEEMAESDTQEEEMPRKSQTEQEVAGSQEEEEDVAEYVSRRAHRSEGGVKGGRAYKSMGAELDPISEGGTTDELHSGPDGEEDLAKSQTEEDVPESQTEEEDVPESRKEEEEEDLPESQTEEEDVPESQTIEDVPESQREEEDLPESQTEEDDVAEYVSRRAHRSEGGVKVPVMKGGGRAYKSMGAELHPSSEGGTTDELHSGPDGEEDLAESQTEEDVPESRKEEEDVPESRKEEEEEEDLPESQTEEEEDLPESQTEEEDVPESRKEEEEEEEEDVPESQTEEDVPESQTEEDDVAEYVSRRAHRSEGGVKVPVMKGGGRAYKSMGAELHPSSEGGTTDELRSGSDEVGVQSDLHHHQTVTLGSVPPSPSPPGNVLETGEVSTRTDASSGNEEGNPVSLLEMDESGNGAYHSSTSPPSQPITAQSPADLEEEEEEEEDEEDDDDARSEELSMKTPAFIRERRKAPPADPLVTPGVLTGSTAQVKPKVGRAKRARPAKKDPGLPKSYIMNKFKHFAKTKVSADVYPVLKQIIDHFFNRLADDLETYAAHAKRKTIEVADVELLLRRQGFVTDSMPLNVLIEKYLPMEYRQLLIPVATSGNIVIPKQRR